MSDEEPEPIIVADRQDETTPCVPVLVRRCADCGARLWFSRAGRDNAKGTPAEHAKFVCRHCVHNYEIEGIEWLNRVRT